MSALAPYIETLELAASIEELGEAFQDLADDEVWKRPRPELLSIGELAAHLVYWDVRFLLGGNFESPLNEVRAWYYDDAVNDPLVLPLGAQQVLAEILRAHEASLAAVKALAPTPDDPNPHREDWTWRYTLQTQALHYAYHTGQMHSVRHLLAANAKK